MIKRTQNKVAESRYLLPVVATIAIGVWAVCGLLSLQWCIQAACYTLSAILMAVLNNNNALIRIFSRMVSCCFLVLSCMACYQFENLQGAFVQFCAIASYVIVFRSYQDNKAVGYLFFSYLCLGLASMAFVQILYFIPFLWLLTATQLNSLSWRTLASSLLGLLTPYWFAACWFLWQRDFTMLIEHFEALAQFQTLGNFHEVSLSQWLVFGFIFVLMMTGVIHFFRNSYKDKIRTRQLYGFFMAMALVVIVFMGLQPQHCNVLMPLLIVNASPIIAHFMALTYTKWTNIAFYVIVATSLLIMAYNVWTCSPLF